MLLKHTTGLLLFILTQTALADSMCPDPKSISRTPGEYAWSSTDNRWEGYFASPRTGRGSSTKVLGFQQARWIQLTDLLDSAGITECDYLGNSPGEVIRFISSTVEANQRPKNLNWSCEPNPEIPSVQCVCAGDTQACHL